VVGLAQTALSGTIREPIFRWADLATLPWIIYIWLSLLVGG